MRLPTRAILSTLRRSLRRQESVAEFAQAPCNSDADLALERGLQRLDPAERWRSGRTRRSRKPEYPQGYRGFESHPLRHFQHQTGTADSGRFPSLRLRISSFHCRCESRFPMKEAVVSAKRARWRGNLRIFPLSLARRRSMTGGWRAAAASSSTAFGGGTLQLAMAAQEAPQPLHPPESARRPRRIFAGLADAGPNSRQQSSTRASRRAAPANSLPPMTEPSAACGRMVERLCAKLKDWRRIATRDDPLRAQPRNLATFPPGRL